MTTALLSQERRLPERAKPTESLCNYFRVALLLLKYVGCFSALQCVYCVYFLEVRNVTNHQQSLAHFETFPSDCRQNNRPPQMTFSSMCLTSKQKRLEKKVTFKIKLQQIAPSFCSL